MEVGGSTTKYKVITIPEFRQIRVAPPKPHAAEMLPLSNDDY